MKNKLLLITLMLFALSSCTKEKVLFEKETWWLGHWQNLDDATEFFSIGQKRVGANGIVTTQFFKSTRDTILSNFHVKNLTDYNHNKKWKLIETSDNKYIKIKEIDELHIDLYGPVNSIDELDSRIENYIKLPESETAPIPDSLLFPS